MNANVSAMVKAGYVVSPNNIWGRGGVGMYPSGPGIMQAPQCIETRVYPDGSQYAVELWHDWRDECHGKFATVDDYLAWVAENGRESLPGLPAFSNSWD